MENRAVIQVKEISKTYSVRWGFFKQRVVPAVNGVSFHISPGETLALVGASGSGKSTVARIILGLERPSAGEVLYRGEPVYGLRGVKQREYRKAVQAVFQDHHSSLNPKMRVRDIVAEPLINFAFHGDIRERVIELLAAVGLTADFAFRFPHQLSGGQKQRVAVARALAAEPEVIVLDEPLSALDVIVQAQILALLNDLKHRFGLGYLFITHDLRVIGAIADRVAVMHRGVIVELAGYEEFITSPKHPHSRALLAAVPVIGR